MNVRENKYAQWMAYMRRVENAVDCNDLSHEEIKKIVMDWFQTD